MRQFTCYITYIGQFLPLLTIIDQSLDIGPFPQVSDIVQLLFWYSVCNIHYVSRTRFKLKLGNDYNYNYYSKNAKVFQGITEGGNVSNVE